MPTLTRRRSPDAREECWHVFYGDVRVGTITIRSGNPHDTDPWQWDCGFYPGSHPREHQSGTAATFDQARADFEAAWAVFLSHRTEADFQKWRDRELVSDDHVNEVRADFEKARALTGKARLAQAKSAVVLHRAGARIPSIADASAAAELRALRQRDQNLDRKLTLAARSGGPNGEADAAGIEEDLAELDAWEAEDQKRP
jgi:hypothetical protein